MAKKKVFSIGSALAEGLEQTIAFAEGYSGELRIDVIPLKKIELDPDNPRDLMLNMQDVYQGLNPADKDYARKTQELESLQSIAHSIKTQGIINPVTVYKYGEHYRLIAGERRTLASILAEKSEIQAKILESKPDQLKISLLQWIENMERSDLSLWERLINLEKIANAHATKTGKNSNQLSVTELSHLIGCSKPHAMHYRSLLSADATLKKLIAENKIKNLEKAALIAEIKSPDVKQQMIDACLDGATLKQLKSLTVQMDRIVKRQLVTEKRGRQTTLVHLGTTKHVHVAKLIFEALMNHESLTHLKKQFTHIDWADHRLVNDVFKHLLQTLETMKV